MNLIFENPPEVRGTPTRPRGSGRGFWLEHLEPLKKARRRWARVADKLGQQHAIVLTHQLRHKKVRIPEGKWEFCSRTIGIEGRVYARYLGPES